MAVLFNRKDAQVKKYAEELTQEEFLKHYEGQTTATVLKSVWKDYNKQGAVAKQIVQQTNEAVDLPEPQVDVTDEQEEVPPPVKKVAKKANSSKDSDDRANPLTNAARGRDASGINEDEVKSARKSKKVDKQSSNAETKTRATRMRELIAEKKDKSAAKEILVAEGYEVGASFHSEWNRVSKK